VPTIIHGSQTFVALEIAARISAADDPSYPSAYFRVPFAGETMRLERAQLAASSEIAAVGAIKTLDYGAGRWRGQFRTLVYYNATFFHILLCQLMGGLEGRTADRLLNGVTAPGATPTTSAHWYIPQSYKMDLDGSRSALTYGLALRISKMGPDTTAGTIEKILGARIVGCTIQQDADGWLTALWDVLGPEPTRLSGVGVTPIAMQSNRYFVKPLDLSKDNTHPVLASISEGGALVNVRNLREFTLRFDNKIEFPPRYATSFDTDNNVGHVAAVEAGSNYVSLLEQESLDVSGGQVYWEFVAGATVSGIRRLRWISAPTGATHSPLTPLADAANNVPYAFEIATNAGVVSEAQNPIESGAALTFRWAERWFRGSIGGATWAPPTVYKVPLLIAAQVADGDDGSAKFNTPATTGGNEPHSTLL